MAKITVHIKHVAWRDGRPRFVPGPSLRAAGWRGRDLRHDNNTWYSLEEAAEWAASFAQALADKGGKPAAPAQPARRETVRAAAPTLTTIGQMVADWLASPRMSGVVATDGRRRRRPLKRTSVQTYTIMMRHIERHAPKFWASPARAVERRHCLELYERLDAALGMSVSATAMSALSAAFAHGARNGMVGDNPVRGLEIERPQPNIRVGTIEEMKHLIATADAMGLPEIGDSIVLGLLTAQRQADRLSLTEDGRREGRIVLRQAKTGALVAVPEMPQLTARLALNRERARSRKVNWPGIVTHERRNLEWTAQQYRLTFNSVVAEAAKTMPSLADFRDKHLRKTAVTWLANAGCSIPEIGEITGHSEASIYAILKHYLGRDPDRARSAIGKLTVWLEKKGATL